jgi:hypothetical protein
MKEMSLQSILWLFQPSKEKRKTKLYNAAPSSMVEFSVGTVDELYSITIPSFVISGAVELISILSGVQRDGSSGAALSRHYRDLSKVLFGTNESAASPQVSSNLASLSTSSWTRLALCEDHFISSIAVASMEVKALLTIISQFGLIRHVVSSSLTKLDAVCQSSPKEVTQLFSDPAMVSPDIVIRQIRSYSKVYELSNSGKVVCDTLLKLLSKKKVDKRGGGKTSPKSKTSPKASGKHGKDAKAMEAMELEDDDVAEKKAAPANVRVTSSPPVPFGAMRFTKRRGSDPPPTKKSRSSSSSSATVIPRLKGPGVSVELGSSTIAHLVKSYSGDIRQYKSIKTLVHDFCSRGDPLHELMKLFISTEISIPAVKMLGGLLAEVPPDEVISFFLLIAKEAPNGSDGVERLYTLATNVLTSKPCSAESRLRVLEYILSNPLQSRQSYNLYMCTSTRPVRALHPLPATQLLNYVQLICNDDLSEEETLQEVLSPWRLAGGTATLVDRCFDYLVGLMYDRNLPAAKRIKAFRVLNTLQYIYPTRKGSIVISSSLLSFAVPGTPNVKIHEAMAPNLNMANVNSIRDAFIMSMGCGIDMDSPLMVKYQRVCKLYPFVAISSIPLVHTRVEALFNCQLPSELLKYSNLILDISNAVDMLDPFVFIDYSDTVAVYLSFVMTIFSSRQENLKTFKKIVDKRPEIFSSIMRPTIALLLKWRRANHTGFKLFCQKDNVANVLRLSVQDLLENNALKGQTLQLMDALFGDHLLSPHLSPSSMYEIPFSDAEVSKLSAMLQSNTDKVVSALTFLHTIAEKGPNSLIVSLLDSIVSVITNGGNGIGTGVIHGAVDSAFKLLVILISHERSEMTPGQQRAIFRVFFKLLTSRDVKYQRIALLYSSKLYNVSLRVGDYATSVHILSQLHSARAVGREALERCINCTH